MAYNYALDAPPRFQWEASSGTVNQSQSTNCGPTCQTASAGYYRNTASYGIEATRRLIMRCCVPCDITAQRDMLSARGVPAMIYRVASMSALKSLIAGGRRPITIRIYMGRVPLSIRGHLFTGWHALLLLTNGTKNGVSGVWVNDPNFSPPGGHRPDPARGHRFYPDSTLNYAFIGAQPAYAIIPIHAKAAPTATRKYVKFNVGAYVSLRLSPDARRSGAYAVADWNHDAIRRVSDNKRLGSARSRRTLFGVVNGYRTDGTPQTYYKLHIAGTGRDEYVDSRFMHRA